MNLKEITVHFAHPAYQLAAAFEARGTGIASFQTWTREEMRERIGDGDVMVCTGFWDNALLPQAKKLNFALQVRFVLNFLQFFSSKS